jgi:hypothetical protein
MWSLEFALLLASVLPAVENPWPDTIGIELPFAFAGAGGVLADLKNAHASGPERDEEVRKGGIRAFRVGATFYAIAVINQLTFGL